ncbi:MAG: tetratricopeptide repeat protein [Blastocatellia bacterium]
MLRISILFCYSLLAVRLIFVQVVGHTSANDHTAPLLSRFRTVGVRHATTNDYVGSAACAACHAGVYQSYSATPMARSSGRVGADDFRESLAASQFQHQQSGARYRIRKEQSGLWLSFERQSPETPGEQIRGERRLDYFIGSGAVARSYLFSLDGFLFQSPVTYYSAQGRWDMSPGYELSETVSLNRPIQTECLQCHASRLQPVKDTQNRYEGAPFLENGVSCERCHGPGRNHVAKMRAGGLEGSREIINPARLAPARRDSICAQCHLTGEEQVTKAGHSLAGFKPGDLLSDHAVSFVWSPAPTDGLTVTSHVEKLAQSRCKQASGDSLWCGSCHDAHSVPAPPRRASYFRQKCLACHQQADCNVDLRLREQEKNDCIACHMPRQSTLDVGHVVYTDHAIPRLARKQTNRAADAAKHSLVPFGHAAASPRDLGLAYVKAAIRLRHQPYFDRAFALLKSVESEIRQDAEALMQLGYLYDRAGDEEKAVSLYRQAIALDPAKIEAAVNLGAILAERGRTEEAIRLWEDALSRNPGFETASLNLANTHLRGNRLDAAESALLKAMAYSPDLPLAHRLLAELRRRKER